MGTPRRNSDTGMKPRSVQERIDRGEILLYLERSRKECGSLRVFCYFISSARTRKTTAITNRQSMAIVMTIRIQDDFSSMSSPPLR